MSIQINFIFATFITVNSFNATVYEWNAREPGIDNNDK